jgi:hypothetical protein
LGSLLVPPDRSGRDLELRLRERTLGAREVVAELGADPLDEPTRRLFGDPVHPDRPFAEVDAAHIAITLLDFARAVIDRRPPEVDGYEGMLAVAAILGAIESGVSGRAVSRDEVVGGTVRAAQDDIDRALGLA